jgi:hypothetical protein
MNIKISAEQYKYLESTFAKEYANVFEKLGVGKLGRNLFDLDEDVLCMVRDWASEKLLRVGFDKDYQVNQEGKFLEDIIDVFYR